MRSTFAIIATVLAALGTPAAAATDREVFALIVTNNHSSQLGRPDLRYADDDGAKYYDVFTLLAPADHVHLLTELDRDTLGLFPQLASIAKPPTRDAVVAAAADLARRSRAALAAGKTVELYFVFAGHGDVDRGAGFVELADGPLTADQLAKHVLSGIPATRTHVILDSCNSFFVINARKPGGRRFATPSDLSEAFTTKLPHVGVFLSTSAEQEVYEWSELQSGIFSHAVRSGVLGAADVDHDGSVSYRELQAFVTIAAAKIKNPLYRPNVFARGPGGKNDAALVDLTRVDAVAITAGPAQTRLTVRDRDALPWIDAHVERGTTIQLRVPRRIADGGAIEVLDRDHVIARRPIPPPEAGAVAVVALDALARAEPVADARGPQSMLRMLFEEPFGPGSYARIGEYLAPVQVFGVSQDDAERMDLLLGAVADQQRSQRIAMGALTVTFGGLAFGGYAYLRHGAPHTPPLEVDVLGFGISGAALLYGAYTLWSSSDGEQIHADYRRRMALRRGDDGAIVADTERRLYELAASHARRRAYLEYAGWAFAGLSALGLVANETLNTEDRGATRFAAVYGISTGVLTAVMARVTRTPEERLAGLWRADPGIRRLPRLGVAPMRGGGMLVLGGSF